MNTTLLVDDDDALINMLRRVLTGAGYDVQSTPNAEQSPLVYAEYQPDLLVADLVMPDGERLRLTIHLSLPDRQVIVAMTEGGRGIKRTCLFVARELGADYPIEKPRSVQEFLSIVRSAIKTEPA